jgi:hypothetical protein
MIPASKREAEIGAVDLCDYAMDLETALAASRAEVAALKAQAGDPKYFDGYGEAPSVYGYCTRCGANNKMEEK